MQPDAKGVKWCKVDAVGIRHLLIRLAFHISSMTSSTMLSIDRPETRPLQLSQIVLYNAWYNSFQTSHRYT
jgi:hypothetical protein